MSWVTDKAAITSAMTTLEYTEIPNKLSPKEAPNMLNHKKYTISLGDPQITQMTNNAEIQIDRVRIEINYLQKDNAAFDANYDLLKGVYNAIKALPLYISPIGRGFYFERYQENVNASIGVIEVYYGQNTN